MSPLEPHASVYGTPVAVQPFARDAASGKLVLVSAAAAGAHDALYLFHRFTALMKRTMRNNAPFHYTSDDTSTWQWTASKPGERLTMYMAEVTDDHLAYFVFIEGPGGGEGMAGGQSVEDFLANGPLHGMPPGVAREIREHIDARKARGSGGIHRR